MRIFQSKHLFSCLNRKLRKKKLYKKQISSEIRRYLDEKRLGRYIDGFMTQRQHFFPSYQRKKKQV